MKLSMLRKLILSIKRFLWFLHGSNCPCFDCELYRVDHHIAIGGDR